VSRESPPELPAAQTVKVVTHQQSYSGPLPPPSVLQGYEQVQAGFAERVIAMAEKEQAHRHQLENKQQSLEGEAVTGLIEVDKRGQNYAFSLCLTLILGSIGLIAAGHELSGSILAGSTVVGLAYVFITGKKVNPPIESASETPSEAVENKPAL
jgi:uncharacterized membrane protein